MALYIGIKNLIGKGAAWLRSKWSTILTQLAAEFRYRVAGGSDNALLPESRGRAILQKVYGKTVKFNQLVDTNTTTVTLVSGHIYYTKISGTASVVTGAGNSIAVTGGVDTVIDLTAAEIDNLTTTTDVEAWLALNVGTQDYYPYDEGSLISFTGNALQVKKDGAIIDEVDLSGAYINVWDEMWESGTINPITGEETPTTLWIRSKNFIPVTPSTSYYYLHPSVSFGIRYYNASKTLIGYEPSSSTSGIYTTPSNCAFIKFTMNASTYQHNVCINVSNADVNGTYYPHALQSAGSVTDEVTESGLTKKIGTRAYQSGDESDPTVVTDGTTTYYPLVTPIVIPHDTPMQYKVDKYSTEEVIVPASADGSPTSTNIVADIEYQAK